MPSESITLRRMATCGEYSSTEEAVFDAAANEIERLSVVAGAARGCINDNRQLGGDVSFVMGGHRRIRLADALSRFQR